jgi:uncharacterized protein (TIGR01777 family)
MEAAKKVMITGASGLIGTRLTEMLRQKGYQVSHLSREKKNGSVKTFAWNIGQHYIEPGALAGVDAIIHLAGAGVADKPWTEDRKEEILLSRTKSTRLLFDELRKANHHVKVFVSASGIAIYGVEDKGKAFKEDDALGDDFLADVTKQWEAEADKISEFTRVCKIRTGLVLSNKGGALPRIALPVKLFVGAPLGNGNQYMNWIHIDDLCAMYIAMIENDSLHGAYNGVAPGPVDNKTFTRAIADVLHKPLWLPAVPAFLLKLILGEMAYIVTKGGKMSSEKIQNTGFHFQFTDLHLALKNVLKK